MHLNLQRIRRNGDGSAVRSAHYVLCTGPFTKEHATLLYVEHWNLPAWTEGRALAFWEAVDAYEARRARLATMLTAAFPRELSLEDQQALTREYLAFVFAEQKVLTWGIHAPQASDGEAQPHLHALYSLRTLDGIDRSPEQFFKLYNSKAPEHGGAQKDLWYESDEALYQMRKVWDFGVAQALERAEMPVPEAPMVPEHGYDLSHTGSHVSARHLQRILTEDDAGTGLHYREREHSMEWSF